MGGNVAGAPRLLELHGSINWSSARQPRVKSGTVTSSGSPRIRVVRNPRTAIDREDCYPVLAPPSWNKSSMNDVFSHLWCQAIECLRKAERVWIIGYSMPKSDPHFKYLLSAGLLGNHVLQKLTIVDPSLEVEGRFRAFLDPIYSKRRLTFPRTKLTNGPERGSTLQEYLRDSVRVEHGRAPRGECTALARVLDLNPASGGESNSAARAD